MNGTTHHYLAPADAPESAARRAAVSHHAVEEAVRQLLERYWSGSIVLGALPVAGEALAIRLAGCHPVQTDAAGLLSCRLQLEARGRQRETLHEEFASLAARLPFRGGKNGSITFGVLRAAGNASFDTESRFGAVRHIASLELEAEIDLLNSTFSPPALPSDTTPNAALPGVLERALAQFIAQEYQLQAQCGTLCKAADGITLQLVRLGTPEEMHQEADFRLTLQLPERDVRFNALSRLLAALPRETIRLKLAGGSEFTCHALSGPEPVRFENHPWPEQRRTAYLTLRMTLDLNQAVFAAADQPDAPLARPLPDPVELERRLSEWLGDKLQLTVDRELWRGTLPHGKNGMAVQFRSQSTNSSSQTVDFGFELLIRDGKRDRAMQLLSRSSRLFPVRGEFGSLEIVCKKAELEPIEELGLSKTQGKADLLIRFAP